MLLEQIRFALYDYSLKSPEDGAYVTLFLPTHTLSLVVYLSVPLYATV